jgi:uncharacterized membrane protein YdjX (TVP38/TMEM64 family)
VKAASALRLGVGLLLLAAIGGALLFLPVKDYLAAFLGRVQALGPWAPVVLGAVYVLACVLFVPGSLLTLGAGFLFGIALGTITVSLASTVGASVAFLLGRTLARQWVEKQVAASPRFRALDQAVQEQGFKIVLLTRLSPVFPFVLLNYAFGLTRVSFRDYVLASWIGMLPGTVMYVYLGSTIKDLADLAAGTVEGGPAQRILFWVGLVATVVVTIFITRLARAALHRAARHSANADGAPEETATNA